MQSADNKVLWGKRVGPHHEKVFPGIAPCSLQLWLIPCVPWTGLLLCVPSVLATVLLPWAAIRFLSRGS